MKKIFTLLFLSVSIILQAQKPAAPTLKKTILLKMPLTKEDDMHGTRGANVAWHPVQKKYYASFAGNSGYPLAIFDVTGKRLSKTDQASLADVRGLWYDPARKTICGNAYDKGGWFYYDLDSRGLIKEMKILYDGMNQPTDQSVGAFDPKTRKVYFLKENKLYRYDSSGFEDGDPLVLQLGRTKKDGAYEDEDEEELMDIKLDYNSTPVFTGIAGYEIGLLNSTKKQLELYNIKDGFLNRVLKLPEDAVVESSFNFAYSNGQYWLFDMETRTWTGYKL